MGLGKHRVLYTAKILRLSEEVSMVVDIVKGREKVGSFFPVGWKITDELVTLEPIKVLSTTADSTLS